MTLNYRLVLEQALRMTPKKQNPAYDFWLRTWALKGYEAASPTGGLKSAYRGWGEPPALFFNLNLWFINNTIPMNFNPMYLNTTKNRRFVNPLPMHFNPLNFKTSNFQHLKS
jgi:hypothetical protein